MVLSPEISESRVLVLRSGRFGQALRLLAIAFRL